MNIICSILFYKIGYHLLEVKTKKIIEKQFEIPIIEEKKINIPPKRKKKKEEGQYIIDLVIF